MAEGLSFTWNNRPIRLKWHRLRRHVTESEFDPAHLALGLALGASMEVDLQALADGSFAVLHDADLSGETDGFGPVAQATAEQLATLRIKGQDRAPLTSDRMASLARTAHPEALLQLDMKNTREDVSAAHIAHFAHHFAPLAPNLIASGASDALIAALAAAVPGMKCGYDPTDALAEEPSLPRMEQRLLACLRQDPKPDMVYLNWEILIATAASGLDMVALAHAEGVAVDAWTHALQDPLAGFSDAEWHRFVCLLDLAPDQITTDSPVATEIAVRARLKG